MTYDSMDNKCRVYDSIRLPHIFLGSPGTCACSVYHAFSPPLVYCRVWTRSINCTVSKKIYIGDSGVYICSLNSMFSSLVSSFYQISWQKHAKSSMDGRGSLAVSLAGMAAKSMSVVPLLAAVLKFKKEKNSRLHIIL